MRKRLALLMASLFLIVGTVWAQTVITDVTQLTDDMECTVKTSNRGGWSMNAEGTQFGSTNDYGFGTTVDYKNDQHVFQFKKVDDKFYLYSVLAKMYIKKDRGLSANPEQAVELIKQDNNTFVVRFDNGHNINLGGDKQMTIDGWGPGGTNQSGKADEGNMVTITDVTAARNLLAKVTFDYYDGEIKIASKEKRFENDHNITIAEVPTLDFHKEYAFKTAGDKIAKNELVVEISCTANFPFTLATVDANGNINGPWYKLNAHKGTKKVAYTYGADVNRVDFVDDNNNAEGYWAFVRVEETANHFKIYNLACSNIPMNAIKHASQSNKENYNWGMLYMENKANAINEFVISKNGNDYFNIQIPGELINYNCATAGNHIDGHLGFWSASGQAPLSSDNSKLSVEPVTDLDVAKALAITAWKDILGQEFPYFNTKSGSNVVNSMQTLTDVVNSTTTQEELNAVVEELKSNVNTYFVRMYNVGRFNDHKEKWYVSGEMVVKGGNETSAFAYTFDGKLQQVSTGKYLTCGTKAGDPRWNGYTSLYSLTEEKENATDFTFTSKGDGVYSVYDKVGVMCDWGSPSSNKVFSHTNANDTWATWSVELCHPLTLTYMYNGEELEDLKVDTYGSVYNVENRIEHFGKVITSCKVGEEVIEPVDGVWPTVTLTGPTTVELTLEDEVPSIFVLQSVTLGTDEDKDKVGDTYLSFTPIKTIETTEASFQTTPSMLYKYTAGTSFAFQSYNDENVYVGASHNFCVTKDLASWNISQPDEDGNVTITRSNDANKYLGHDTNTKANTGLYTNVGSGCNKWKIIPAYPITIIYVCDDKTLETIKDAAITGSSFTAEIDTHGGTLVSCIDDKGTTLEVNNSILTIAEVTEPITITVTLENAKEGGVVEIGDWKFGYEPATNGIKLTDVKHEGSEQLVIKSEYEVNGVKQEVVAISPNFLHGNTKVTSVTLPASLVNLGFRKVEPMFVGEYEGQPGDGTVTKNEDGTTTTQGTNRCYIFPNDPHTGKPFMVNKKTAWRLTLDVTINDVKNDFNEFGSAIVSTNANSLADYYTNHMQIYLHDGHKDIVVKMNNSDDRYKYNTYVLDGTGNETNELLVNTHFKFELEHDGTGGYQIVIYYENGKAKMYNITADNNIVDFDRLYYSLPEGIHVDVKFDRLISEGLFVGCTSLTEIIVDENNPTFKSCEHGVLYDKNGYYVMRIPEGETGHQFEIPSKVVKLYAGAVHGVNADIVLHSNPDIGVVEGHEDAVKKANFYLSLDDIDNTITESETGYGGARDFTSANTNTYLGARYKRTPLEAGVYGTICLPFAIEESNAIMQKYDFFKFKSGNATSLTFSQVTALEVNEPYLYKLKDGVDKTYNVDRTTGNDVFQSAGAVEIVTKDKYDPKQHKPGTYHALGSFVNYYVETAKYPNSAFYYYSLGQSKFLKVTQKLTYRPYRAFFVVTPKEGEGGASKAPARLSLCLLDGTTTDIDASLVEGMETPVYYDLSGRRVLNPGSGVYIVNGKKVFIK